MTATIKNFDIDELTKDGSGVGMSFFNTHNYEMEKARLIEGIALVQDLEFPDNHLEIIWGNTDIAHKMAFFTIVHSLGTTPINPVLKIGIGNLGTLIVMGIVELDLPDNFDGSNIPDNIVSRFTPRGCEFISKKVKEYFGEEITFSHE